MMHSSNNSSSNKLTSLPNAKQYSKATQDLVKGMMQDAKLNKFQMKQLEQKMQTGKQLPANVHPSNSKGYDTVRQVEDPKIFGEKNNNALIRKKKLGAIVAEKAYEPDTHYKPAPPRTLIETTLNNR